MNRNTKDIYPNCPTRTRTVPLGLFTKDELIQKLKEQNIQTNEFAEILLKDHHFTISKTPYFLQTVELKVKHLGFSNGATLPDVFQKAKEMDLQLCPLEVGPILRLMDNQQEEGALDKPLTKNQAPYGSYTIASPIISTDDTYPKGFYLRKIKCELWLRGYTCDHLHVFQTEDKFVFGIYSKAPIASSFSANSLK